MLRSSSNLCWLSVALAQSSLPYRAVARLRGATGVDSAVSGNVTFEQLTPLGDVTVHVDVHGLRAGSHGFHVHQFGDVRSTSDLATMGRHFIPYCAPPDVDDNGQLTGGCDNDQVHGLPPSLTRQPGDMGNVQVGNDRTVAAGSRVLTIGQAKMSLADPLRSIVGRTVLVCSTAPLPTPRRRVRAVRGWLAPHIR
jgi:Cu-Zn family superoxide dismutase